MLIDEFMPVYDVFERHQVTVKAAAERVYEVARRLDVSGSAAIRALFFLRSLPAMLRSSQRRKPRLGITIEGLLKSGFILLGEAPPQEFVLGAVGRFWTSNGDMQRLDAAGFQSFQQAGFAKSVWNFRICPRKESTTELVTETRVQCLDAASRKRFLQYWRVIGPFSGLIRKEALRCLKREAEDGSR